MILTALNVLFMLIFLFVKFVVGVDEQWPIVFVGIQAGLLTAQIIEVNR